MNRLCLFLAAVAGASIAHGASIATFNFNSTSNDANTGTGSAAASTGVGTAAGAGSVTTSYNSGSNDDANTTDNSALAFTALPAQGTNNLTAGVAFTGVSTAGVTDPITISFSLRGSGTSSRYYQLQESTDGGLTYNNVSGGTAGQPTTAGTAAITSSAPTGSIDSSGFIDVYENSGSQVFIYPYSYTLSAADAGENNAQFAFRIVAAFAPSTSTYVAASDSSTYATTGNTRIDSVSVSTAPEPASVALLSLASLGVLRRRKA